MDRPEVIVVGAGPVGLTVALGLARAGRRVLVLEKDPGTVERSRAPAIWAGSQEILAGLGVLDRFVAAGITLDTLRLCDADGTGDALLSLPVHELTDETPFPRLLILPQSRTERLLCEAVRAEATARVLFSAEVTGADQHPDGVTVHYTYEGARHSAECAFAVGADGARSRVREILGAAFEGETYALRAALADVTGAIPDAISDTLPFPRISTADGLVVGIRIDAGVWRLILPFGGTDELPLTARVQRAAMRLFPGVASERDYETLWRSEFNLHRLIATRFVHHRIALAGDAAHLNSPVGGQGMNAGIRDAAVLTDHLLEALEADDPAPLERYESERRAAIDDGVNRFTDLLTRGLLLRQGRLVRPVLAVARTALRVAPLRRRFLRRIALQE